MGPPLHVVAATDEAGLRLLFQEQRARMAVVRDHAIWHWLGGVPQGFGSPKAALRGVHLQLGFVAVIAVALVVAGFTRGPVLWGAAALAPLLLVARDLAFGRHVRATVRLYRRAILVPVSIVHRSLDSTLDDLEVWNVSAVLSPLAPDPASFRRVLEAGARLRAMVERRSEVPGPLADLVDAIKSDIDPAHFCGSRVPLPEAIGAGLELARFVVPPRLLPDERLTSRLLFVFLDPGNRAPGHVRVAQPLLYGEGGESLSAAMPWEAKP